MEEKNSVNNKMNADHNYGMQPDKGLEFIKYEKLIQLYPKSREREG